MIARLVCLIVGHRTAVTFTDTEGLVQCQCCQKVLDRWPVLRPEEGHRARARHAAFWAKVDAQPERPALRRVK